MDQPKKCPALFVLFSLLNALCQMHKLGSHCTVLLLETERKQHQLFGPSGSTIIVVLYSFIRFIYAVDHLAGKIHILFFSVLISIKVKSARVELKRSMSYFET